MDSLGSRGPWGPADPQGQWDPVDSRASLAYLVYQGPEDLLVSEAGLCPDTKEKRESRGVRGLRGPSRSWSLQKIATSKETRVLRVLKGSVEVRVYRAWTVFLEKKARLGFWDFLDPGVFKDFQVVLDSEDRGASRELQASQV